MSATQIASGQQLGTDFQRQLIDTGSRYFLFYSDGTNLTYISSADGSTWTSGTDIRACTNYKEFSIWHNQSTGTVYYVYVDCTSYDTDVAFCKGTISGTTITFGTEYLIHNSSTSYDQHSYPSVCVTPSGKAIVTVSYYDDNAWYWYVIGGNCSDDVGQPDDWTWTTLLADKDYEFYTSAVPLSTGETYAIYWSEQQSGYDNARGRLWNTTAWESEETVTSTAITKTSLSAVNQAGNIHIIHMYSSGSDRGIIYRKRNSTAWESEITLKNASSAQVESFSGLSLSINQSSTELFACWTTKTSKDIVYQWYDGSSWQSNYTIWLDLSVIPYEPALPYEFISDRVPVCWRQGSPTVIKFMYGVPQFNPESLETTNSNMETDGQPYVYDSTHTLTALTYHPKTLTFTVSAESGLTSTTTIDCADLGEPVTVQNADSTSYDASTKRLTVTVTHASTREITVSWTSSSSGYYVLSVYLKQGSKPLTKGFVAIIDSAGETLANKTVNTQGLASFELIYDTYRVEARAEGETRWMYVWLTSNKDVGIDFGEPAPYQPVLEGLILVPVIIALAIFWLRRARR